MSFDSLCKYNSQSCNPPPKCMRCKTHAQGQGDAYRLTSALRHLKDHLKDGRRQCESGNELACQVGKIDEAPDVSLFCLLELVPQAILQGDSVRFAGSQQALQQVHIIGVPAALLQAALHCDSNHLPLCLPLHCIAPPCLLYTEVKVVQAVVTMTTKRDSALGVTTNINSRSVVPSQLLGFCPDL